MNNNMAINTYLSIIESKKQPANTKKRDRIMDMESILMVASRWRGEGIKKYL